MKEAYKHILISVAVLFLIIAVPFISSPYFITDADAVSSASVIVSQPSGIFYVFINTEKHTDKEALLAWKDYFANGEFPMVFEDITCYVISSDESAAECAASFSSRLGENQMTVVEGEGSFLLSKAEAGRYDVFIMSEEYYEAYGAESLADRESSAVIKVRTEEED